MVIKTVSLPIGGVERFQAAILTVLLCAALPFMVARAATYTPQEQANMKLVANFYAALDKGDADGNLKQKIRAIAEQYLDPDYIQHTESARQYGPGREGFITMFEQMPAMAPPGGAMKLPPAKVLSLLAAGDLVVRVSSRSMPGPAGNGDANSNYIFNMFRIKDGKLAEHWDGASASMMPGRAPGAPGGRSN